ncbi:hypothetical protein PUV54_15695 [Hyphococcus flavus]|uniref:Uncharacterized protein n=1 Tax=Hyphococcus flavus TaxID=1866326 RepID=A0AAF0CFT2_9PROT|nr:hypothetical protein [Hyphococcus flavus]WDI31393.1 hypothetical protein PUV54_15695 [Hyphococcus flavus]
MKPIVLRHLIIGLLVLTGIFHLAVALLNAAPGLGWSLTAFGVIYTGLSFYVRRDVHMKKKPKKGHINGRTAIIVTMAVCATGLALGGSNYIQNGGPLALPIMFAVDIAIIAAGAMWLMKVHTR